MLEPVYDIVNCGPRHRFVANGKLVHNSDGVNLQNLPRGGALRQALRAPEGHKIISCDSSQIEARMVAYLAGQSDLVQWFREGRDVYSEFATVFYGRKVTKADKLERHVGKSAILGLGYGMSAEKFQLTLKRGKPPVDIPEEDVERLVRTYRTGYHQIVKLWGECGYALSSMAAGRRGRIGNILTYDADGILLPNGMRLQYHGLTAATRQFTYIQDRRMFDRAMKARLAGDPKDADSGTIAGQSRIYGAMVAENVTQALARIVVAEQMLAIRDAGYHVAFQVHDENVCIVPEDQAEQAEKDIVAIMSTAPTWAPDLPVACEAGTAYTYGDT